MKSVLRVPAPTGDPSARPMSPDESTSRAAPIFVVDRKGVVKAKLALEGYKVRPDGDAVLKAVDALR